MQGWQAPYNDDAAAQAAAQAPTKLAPRPNSRPWGLSAPPAEAARPCGGHAEYDHGEEWIGELGAVRTRDAVVTAQATLGYLAARGRGGPVNLSVARAWLAKAAEHGHPTGLLGYGRLCVAGLGGAVDLTTARTCFGRAAKHGLVEAMRAVAELCANGEGGPVNLQRARTWRLQAASHHGDVSSAVSVGSMLRLGQGGDVDAAEARRWFGVAAESGDALAQCHLAFMCHMGEGGPRDPARARAWYVKSAVQPGPHRAVAQTALGNILNDGEGGPRDAKAARLWFTKAAHLGQPEAQQMLGLLMWNGEGGREDREKAREWLQRSAEAGRASKYWHAKQSGHGPKSPMGPRQGFPCLDAGKEARRAYVPRKEEPNGTLVFEEHVEEPHEEAEAYQA